MVNNKEKTVAKGAQTATKKVRRGVSNKTQAVAQLKFHEKDAAQNGLFVGHLEEVRVDWSNSEDSKDFPSMSVPRLTIHFASNHPNASEKRHVHQTLFPIPSNVNTIPGGTEEWKVNNVFNWIKHILDVFYLKGRELTVAEEKALSLPFDDTDDNGGDTAKPCFKTADGKFIPCWLKLLRHKKRKNDWINVTQNGDLGFDGFIGNGVVELLKKDVPPTVLRLDLAKESITPKETKKAPTIGAPGMAAPGMGGVMAGGPIGDMGGMYNPGADASAAAGSDMPF